MERVKGRKAVDSEAEKRRYLAGFLGFFGRGCCVYGAQHNVAYGQLLCGEYRKYRGGEGGGRGQCCVYAENAEPVLCKSFIFPDNKERKYRRGFAAVQSDWNGRVYA